jgi:hypothetical protein
MVDILTFWSPHKLLKNLGALSEYAKIQPKFDQNKKNCPFNVRDWSKFPVCTTVVNYGVPTPLKTGSTLTTFPMLIFNSLW